MLDNSTIVRYASNAIGNYELKIKLTKTKSRGEDLFTYNITPQNLSKTYPYKVKYNAKKVQKIFDWSTAVISYPPGVKQSAVEFKVDIIRAMHTLKHDGYYLGFITDKR